MDFAVGIGRTESIHEVGDHARVAEECGFKYVSVVDIPFLGREVDSMMTMAALSTTKDPHRTGGDRSGHPSSPRHRQRDGHHRRAFGRARLRRHRHRRALGQADVATGSARRAAGGGNLHQALQRGRGRGVARRPLPVGVVAPRAARLHCLRGPESVFSRRPGSGRSHRHQQRRLCAPTYGAWSRSLAGRRAWVAILPRSIIGCAA